MTTTQKSTRGNDRRELILKSAADLMADRGYPAVSMTQIGAAAGIVGSGVYRHFESKSMLLSALLDRVVTTMLEGSREVVAGGLTGVDLLGAMIRIQSQIAIEHRSVVAVYLQDAGNLPPEGLRTLRRQQRQLVEEWIGQCEAIAPSPGEVRSRTAVHAVFALINSVCTYDNPLPSEQLIESLATMARAALYSGLGLVPAEPLVVGDIRR